MSMTDPKTKVELTTRLSEVIDWAKLGKDGQIIVKRIKDNAVELVFPQSHTRYMITVSKPLPPNSERGRIVGERMREVMALARAAKAARLAAEPVLAEAAPKPSGVVVEDVRKKKRSEHSIPFN